MTTTEMEAVKSHVKKHNPECSDWVAETLAEGKFKTSMDDIVDMDDYPPGEADGPGGIFACAGFMWRPAV
jgi:hypothetical protein